MSVSSNDNQSVKSKTSPLKSSKTLPLAPSAPAGAYTVKILKDPTGLLQGFPGPEEAEQEAPPKIQQIVNVEPSVSRGSLDENYRNIGSFTTDNYKMIKGYLQGNGPHLRLFYTKLEPLGQKLASLCIVHGMGDHSGRYMEIAEYFVKQAFVVHLIDLRGYGLSGGAKANASVKELHLDLEVLLRQASPNLPLFVYGHSMGAVLVTSLLIRNPYLSIAGVILTSGFFKFSQERKMSWIKRTLIKHIGGHLHEFVMNSLMNPTSLTLNNYSVQKLAEDNLITPYIGIRHLKALVNLVEFTIPNSGQFSYPCLIIHGNSDLIADYGASMKFYKTISSRDKELKVIEEGMHDMEHDNNKEQLKATILEWMQKKLKKAPRNIGEFNYLHVGLVDKNKYAKLLIMAALILLYSILLKNFRGNKLYNTKLKLFCYPVFYIINILKKLRTQ